MTNRHPARPAQRGITLIESMCALSIASIVIGAAIPSLGQLRQKAHLRGVAAQLETDVQFARGQASALNRTVRLTLREVDGATCYIVHTGPAADCNCSGPNGAACGGTSEMLRAVSFAAGNPVQVRSATRSMTFDPVRGTVTPTATLRVEGSDGRALHQIVNLLGRVRTCSPAAGVVDERAC